MQDHNVVAIDKADEAVLLADPAAVQAAVHQAWQRLQEEQLRAGYAAAVADNPHYPYESANQALAIALALV